MNLGAVAALDNRIGVKVFLPFALILAEVVLSRGLDVRDFICDPLVKIAVEPHKPFGGLQWCAAGILRDGVGETGYKL